MDDRALISVVSTGEPTRRKTAWAEDLSERDGASLIEARWWRDVVYDPKRSDNEEQSTILAEQYATQSSWLKFIRGINAVRS